MLADGGGVLTGISAGFEVVAYFVDVSWPRFGAIVEDAGELDAGRFIVGDSGCNSPAMPGNSPPEGNNSSRWSFGASVIS